MSTSMTATAQVMTAKPKPSGTLVEERVTEVHHWTDTLFSFRTTRDPSVRFESGQFVMIGLEIDGKPLLRAYSIASAVYDDYLEFFSIKVPNGPLTSRLQNIKQGDTVLVGRKPTGTLVASSLKPGRRLYMLATGTGFAPFASLIKDPAVYETFESVIVVHGCRTVAEVEYSTRTVMDVRQSEFLAEYAQDKLVYYATVTREPYYHQGRITDLASNGKLFTDLGYPPLNREEDRVMLCGNPDMLRDLRAMLDGNGFIEGSSSEPGDYVIEKAFVER